MFFEKLIGIKENPSTIDDLKEESSLRYERLSMKAETAKINYLGE
jgi:hypothetical protein